MTSAEAKEMSIKSLESTYNKLSNAYKSISEKGSNTTLVLKRLNAVEIGIKSLKDNWNSEGFFYDEEPIRNSKEVLEGIIPSIEKQIERAKKGSAQKTINERRLTALKLAIESLEQRLN
ncbi:hypothetical protein [Alkalihalobacillus sp. CinArs1]|uniref:hypothetical protein n=1 Tax=Alkalihalobacillus sp. CinArs1 TaxID=2995314 RepID=UPI0022DE863A|nr:hypothetical protein [Alkalihalobacillus sp. CinArs1]